MVKAVLKGSATKQCTVACNRSDKVRPKVAGMWHATRSAPTFIYQDKEWRMVEVLPRLPCRSITDPGCDTKASIS